jgi:23S rRNA (guanosine2251-2'-O)-methyltransferase
MQNKKEFVFGTRVALEAIEAGQEIEKVLIQKNVQNELVNELTSALRRHNIPYTRVPQEKLDRISRKNHQGVICFLSPIHYASIEHVLDSAFSAARDPLLLVLDRVTDVRNFGAIARTAECMGVNALVIQDKGNAPIGADAMKTSAGALHHLPVCRVRDLRDTLKYLQNSGLKIVACSERADTKTFDADLSGPLALVMGSEEDGIAPELLKLAHHSVALPLLGQISSLNVSVAAGMALYEVLRQREAAG